MCFVCLSVCLFVFHFLLFVCLFVFAFLLFFVCYHSRAVDVESALGLEMLDPSLSSKADRRPVEVGPAEFLKCERNRIYTKNNVKFVHTS